MFNAIYLCFENKLQIYPESMGLSRFTYVRVPVVKITCCIKVDTTARNFSSYSPLKLLGLWGTDPRPLPGANPWTPLGAYFGYQTPGSLVPPNV